MATAVATSASGISKESPKPNESGNEKTQQTQMPSESERKSSQKGVEITYEPYTHESQLYELVPLIDQNLSEPYSTFTFRHFVNEWPQLCILARHEGKCVGGVMCKMERDNRVNYSITRLNCSDFSLLFACHNSSADNLIPLVL